MLSEKAYALCLLEILQEHSDAEHILPMREIIAKMQVIYGIRPDRRTIYAAAALLIGLGYDLSVYEENGVGAAAVGGAAADRRRLCVPLHFRPADGAVGAKAAKAVKLPPAQKIPPLDHRPAAAQNR